MSQSAKALKALRKKYGLGEFKNKKKTRQNRNVKVPAGKIATGGWGLYGPWDNDLV